MNVLYALDEYTMTRAFVRYIEMHVNINYNCDINDSVTIEGTVFETYSDRSLNYLIKILTLQGMSHAVFYWIASYLDHESCTSPKYKCNIVHFHLKLLMLHSIGTSLIEDMESTYDTNIYLNMLGITPNKIVTSFDYEIYYLREVLDICASPMSLLDVKNIGYRFFSILSAFTDITFDKYLNVEYKLGEIVAKDDTHMYYFTYLQQSDDIACENDKRTLTGCGFALKEDDVDADTDTDADTDADTDTSEDTDTNTSMYVDTGTDTNTGKDAKTESAKKPSKTKKAHKSRNNWTVRRLIRRFNGYRDIKSK